MAKGIRYLYKTVFCLECHFCYFCCYTIIIASRKQRSSSSNTSLCIITRSQSIKTAGVFFNVELIFDLMFYFESIHRCNKKKVCNIKAVTETLGNPQNCDTLPKYLNVDYVCQVSRINNVLWISLQRVKPFDMPCNNCGCLFFLLFSFLATMPLTPASQRGTLTLFSAVTYQEDMSIQDMIA